MESVDLVVRFFRLTDVGHRRQPFMMKERTLAVDLGFNINLRWFC